MKKPAVLIGAFVVAQYVLFAGRDGLPARADTDEQRVHASAPVLCTCGSMCSGTVGWCLRHSRGYAYGHALRTGELMAPLLPCDADPYSAACPAGHARPAAGQPAAGDQASNRAKQPCAAVPPPSGPGAVAMANALLKCGAKSDYGALTAVPGYCDLCKRVYVNGHVYRSWVVAALEAGQRLPGLPDPLPGSFPPAQSPTTQPVPADGSPQAQSTGASAVAQPSPPSSPGADSPTPGCEACKKAFADGAVWAADGLPVQPFCERCDVGVVAGRVFTGREAYELAKAADAALASKRMHRCQRCAIGVLEGGRCTVCSECRKCHAEW